MINGQLLGIVPGLGFQPQKKKKWEKKFSTQDHKTRGKSGCVGLQWAGKNRKKKDTSRVKRTEVKSSKSLSGRRTNKIEIKAKIF